MIIKHLWGGDFQKHAHLGSEVTELTVPNAVLEVWCLCVTLGAGGLQSTSANLVLISALSTSKNQGSVVTP